MRSAPTYIASNNWCIRSLQDGQIPCVTSGTRSRSKSRMDTIASSTSHQRPSASTNLHHPHIRRKPPPRRGPCSISVTGDRASVRTSLVSIRRPDGARDSILSSRKRRSAGESQRIGKTTARPVCNTRWNSRLYRSALVASVMHDRTDWPSGPDGGTSSGAWFATANSAHPASTLVIRRSASSSYTQLVDGGISRC